MKIETYSEANKVLENIENLTNHLREIDKGINSDRPLSVWKLGGGSVRLDPSFFNYDEFIANYTARIKERIAVLNEQFEKI